MWGKAPFSVISRTTGTPKRKIRRWTKPRRPASIPGQSNDQNNFSLPVRKDRLRRRYYTSFDHDASSRAQLSLKVCNPAYVIVWTMQEIGRAQVCTPVTTSHLVCRLLL